MRKAEVYYKDSLAGTIMEIDEGYVFCYEPEYLKSLNPKPISLTLPLQMESYESKILFPVFDGLIPEGWLLDLVVDNWKISERDRFGLLLLTCKDCIGCLSILSKS